MAEQTVDALVEGGKATAAPPLGPALGPLGVNIGQVVAEINKKTADFKGMQVPVTVTVDSNTKEFSVSVGTPPASQLILKEAGVKKGSGNPLVDKVADLKIEQIIKISKMKQDGLTGKSTKERVKEIIGTCNSMGILVEGVPATEAIKLVNEGSFDEEITQEKTELSAEELQELEAEKQKLAAEMEKRRSEFEAKAKAILSQMDGQSSSSIRTKMREVKIPEAIIMELVPAEAAGAEAKKPEPAKK